MALIKNKINVEITKRETIGQNLVRINGWTYPLHWLQLLAWLFYLFMCLVAFTFIVPTLPNTELRVSMIAVASLVLIAHFIAHVIAVNINPADDQVVDKLMQRRDRPSKFDRSKHSHVIENQFCYICETNVGSKSKHCSLCNKCVSDFDHHCKWLNNCVGGKNYRWFVVCVLTATMGTVLIFVNCLILTIAYFSDNSWLYDQTSTLLYFNSDSQINQNLQLFWIAVIIISLVLSLTAFLLLTHLLGFHLFLNCVGLSTYDFVVQQRKRKTETLKKTSTTKRYKLFTYLTRMKLCLMSKVRRKRVNPTDLKIDLNQIDKHSIKSISSAINTKSNSDGINKTYQNGDIDLEKGEVVRNKLNESISPSKTIDNLSITKSSPNFTEIINKNKSPDKNDTFDIDEPKVIDNEEASDATKVKDVSTDHKVSDSDESFTKEPIFKPLTASVGQNGRISRLSFTNSQDFVMPSVSPDLDLISKFKSNPFQNHTIVRYNSYAKYKNDKNLRIDSLKKNLENSKEIHNNKLKITINTKI